MKKKLPDIKKYSLIFVTEISKVFWGISKLTIIVMYVMVIKIKKQGSLCWQAERK